ncbi:unnamed protein product [Peronospora destructor]|uniref:Uncharacterized protein n=1 Tax=Peronospora destructor TaxID=86335 RepID=A0AAV0V042_9STRA|nr:unnamed protein product [Peronospora destructor]
MRPLCLLHWILCLGGGVFSLQASSPISTLDGQDASVSSQSNAFGSGHGSFGLSLGYPSFNTFNDVGSFSSEPLMSGWGNSASSNNTNGNRNNNDDTLGRGLGLPFRGLDMTFMTSSTTSGGTGDAQSHGFSSHVGGDRPFAPMADLAAVERESALYRQRASSLSAFLGASTPASQTETHSPSSSRMPARPPPGFAATSMEGQQQQQQQLTPNLLFQSVKVCAFDTSVDKPNKALRLVDG